MLILVSVIVIVMVRQGHLLFEIFRFKKNGVFWSVEKSYAQQGLKSPILNEILHIYIYIPNAPLGRLHMYLH